jgi:hypothetical protein
VAESVYSPLGRARALCGLQPCFAPAIDLAPRIRRMLIDHILEDYDERDCDSLLSDLQGELLRRQLLDDEALRTMDSDLSEIATGWQWL